ncbi:MAG: Toxin-antitoxin biofilm protein TabA [Lentisphaerae bacterium ADurb.Bin242]|nr:MAG: Toxin-antitoxin biofilm protein TabA [Lentisphaerae bacterium ADurb.Bin242]
MIYDSLSNTSSYPLGPAFRKAVEFLRSLNAGTPTGRHEIDGDKLYANVMEYETQEAAPVQYEVHRKYADLQALITGSETLFARSADGLAVESPYNAEKDCAFLAAPANRGDVKLLLEPGNFALLFPQDAHMGKGAGIRGAGKLKKAVVKIALDALKQ